MFHSPSRGQDITTLLWGEILKRGEKKRKKLKTERKKKAKVKI
jgi:hypothetical protein